MRERAELLVAFAPRPRAAARRRSATPTPAAARRRVDRERPHFGDVRAERRQLGAADDLARRAPRRRTAPRARSSSPSVRGSRWPSSRFAVISACSFFASAASAVRSVIRPGSVCHSASSHGAERRIQTTERLVDLGLRDDERRQQPHDRLRRPVDDDAALERRPARPAPRRVVSSRPHISPAPRTSLTIGVSRGDRAQPLLEMRADAPDVREQAAADQLVEEARARRGRRAGCRRRCCRDRRTRSCRRPPG